MPPSKHDKPDLLILTFPAGSCLSRWERFGVIDRELPFIQGVGQGIPRILCVSTAGDDERRIAARLAERTDLNIEAISDSEPDPNLGLSRTLEQRVLAYAAGARRIVIQTLQYDDAAAAIRLVSPLRRAGARVALVARGSFIESRVLASAMGPHHFRTLSAAEQERRICAQAQMVLGTSESMLDELCWKHGINTDRTRIVSQHVTIPNDVNELAAAREPNRIVTTGRFSGGCPAIRFAIEAVSQLTPGQREQLTLEVIGDGPDGLSLPGYARSLGVRAEFRRGLDHKELIASLGSATLYLQPENARRQSITVLEAMALGCPVVVADLPEYNGLIENGSSGIRVAQEPRAYSFAIDCLLGDAGFRAMLGETAHTRIAFKCDTDRVISATLDAYGEALHAAPKQGEGPDRIAS